jgi:hypothetical protein
MIFYEDRIFNLEQRTWKNALLFLLIRLKQDDHAQTFLCSFPIPIEQKGLIVSYFSKHSPTFLEFLDVIRQQNQFLSFFVE